MKLNYLEFDWSSSRDRGFRVHLSQALVVHLRFPSPPLNVENLRVNLTTTHSLAVSFGALCSYTPGCHTLSTFQRIIHPAVVGSGLQLPRLPGREQRGHTSGSLSLSLSSSKPHPQAQADDHVSKPPTFLVSRQTLRAVYDEKPVRMIVKGFARDALSTSLLSLCRLDLTVERLPTDLPCQDP
ncbi:hypothetical protein CMEL01_02965 [Colletotrichum melonis]|uniref:Uncharacterized protein n=1 Tax=Colletotrichum melonis TaxID=1209925 RepID=A0AAI9UKD0_9PEZI|nr:hypothetical protein CMEL01_02965 [Colletotrichum melonis]